MSRSPPTRTTRSFFSTTSHKPGPTPCWRSTSAAAATCSSTTRAGANSAPLKSAPPTPPAASTSTPRQLPLHVVLLRRLRTHRQDPLLELPRRRLLPRVRQRPLGRIRAAALHQGPDGRPRPHHLQVPRTRGQGGRQGPHRRSSEVRSARTALSLSAVRLLLDRGRQHHDRGGTVGQGPSRGRDRPRGLAGRVTDFPA